MKYELNGLVFFNVVKGSTPPTDEVDCCIYPGQGELKIVTYSTDLSVCTISEVVCDTQNYKKTDPFLFPVFEFLNRVSSDDIKQVTIEIFTLYITVTIHQNDYSITFKKQTTNEQLPKIFTYIPISPPTEFCTRIKKDILLKILSGCDQEDILDFTQTSINIVNPYSWDTIKYKSNTLSVPPSTPTSFIQKNIINYMKYLCSNNAKMWLQGNNTPIIIKSMSDDVESTLYISPYVYTRENMDTDEIVDSVLSDIVNDISEN